jgi:malate/lactate dehydrogenase
VTREELDQIANETKNKAMTIINKKRFTQWGIGACCASICRVRSSIPLAPNVG